MKIKALLEDVPYRIGWETPDGAEEKEIEKIVTSCQTGLENALFVCSKASLRDGAAQMRAAYEMGCRHFVSSSDASPGEGSSVWVIEEPDRHLGELAARLYGYPARELTVLGVTGGLHATRTALLLEQILLRAGHRVASVMRAGMRHTGAFLQPGPLLPDALALQTHLAELRRTGVEIAVLELTAHQLAHFAAESIPFTVVLLSDTAFEPTEAQGFSNLLAWEAAQDRLLCAPSSVVILPPEREAACAGRVWRIGREVKATDLTPFFDEKTGHGSRFSLHIGGESATVTLPLPGGFSVTAALGAAAMARLVGVSPSAIASALCEAQLIGYTEYLPLPYGRGVYIDAAYSPAAIAEVLQALRDGCKGRLCVLLGSVGGRAVSRRPLLGEVAERYADAVYLTADDPDAEDPAAICADILRGMKKGERACVIPDRREAILRAVRELRPGDILLLAGKGRDTRQLIGGSRLPFREREIVYNVKF